MDDYMFKILLASNLELAAQKELNFTATVEAEYGETVIKGSVYTLAHHTKQYKNCPAPCNTNVQKLPPDSTILVSHLDLDTIGGCMALMGIKPEDQEFWQGAEFIDLNGAHNLFKLSNSVQEKLKAFWAWNNKQERKRYTEVEDVTEKVLLAADIITKILQQDKELLTQGEEWHKTTSQEVESKLIKESSKVRVFVTDGVFCNTSYYSPLQNKVIPAIVTLNTKINSITVSMEDGGKSISAKEIVQILWGQEAGGHNGIAGSPRGWEVTPEQLKIELERAVKAVETLLNN